MTKAGRYAILGDLALVFAVALGFRLMWVVLIPPWTAPDEASHFTYVAHLVEQREIPRPPPHGQEYPYHSLEVTHSWELFLFSQISGIGGVPRGMLLPYLPVDHDYAPARRYKEAHEQRLTSSGATATDYPPLYYLVGAVFYGLFQESTLLSRLFAVRAGSALLGALSCSFGYLFAFELTRRRRWGHAVGMSMAMMPMYVFITSSVNNDPAVFLTSTVVCWLIVKVLRCREVPLALAAWIGGGCGLVLLTKPNGVTIVLAAGTVLAYRSFPWRIHPARFISRRLLVLVVAATGVLLVAGPWFVFRIVTAAALPAESTTDEMLIDSILAPQHSLGSYLQHQYSLGLPYLQRLAIRTYWGCFGWLEVYLSDRVYTAIAVVYATGALGLVVQWIREPASRPRIGWLLALVGFHKIFLFLVADYYLTYARTGADFGMQGRYFFPTLAPFLFLLLSGVNEVFAKHRLFLRLVPSAMLLLQGAGLAVMLDRYYGVAFL